MTYHIKDEGRDKEEFDSGAVRDKIQKAEIGEWEDEGI